MGRDLRKQDVIFILQLFYTDKKFVVVPTLRRVLNKRFAESAF